MTGAQQLLAENGRIPFFTLGLPLLLCAAVQAQNWELEAQMHYPSSHEQVAPEKRGGGPSFEEQVAALVNVERMNNGGLPPLKANALLDQSSETHSVNMGNRNFFAHCDVDTGTNPGQRITQAGYNWNSWAENIAAGRSTAAAVMAGWMASSGHRANILSSSFRELGVGYFFDSSDSGNVRVDDDGDCTADGFGNGPFFHYWTQNFGRRNSVYPVVIERETYEVENAEVAVYLYGNGIFDQMRVRNETGAWTAWMPHAEEWMWVLSNGSGLKEVHVEMRNGGGPVSSVSDTVFLNQACVPASQFNATVSAWPSAVNHVLLLVNQLNLACD